MRWIWIDNFLEFHRGQSARAVKNLSLAEDYFADHFPGFPVMPAALILEGLAQTGGILVGEVNDFKEKVVLAKITSARFFREVLAGQQLVYDVEMLNLRTEGASVRGRASVRDLAAGLRAGAAPAADGRAGGALVAEAEIFFAHLDRSRSAQLFGDQNFVFTGELKNLLGITRILANRPEVKGETE
jgi:3-hydroxyacyl-[acyl-carrier-protein] dehydratase